MAIRRSLALAIVVLATTAGAVFATHTSAGLSSTLLARATWDRADLSALAHELGALHQLDGSDVVVVRATLAPGGTTDWHGHPGPSVAVVTSGTIRVLEPAPGQGCIVTDYASPQAFFHSEGAHNFVNPSTTTEAEFLVTYFAPAGPLLSHEANPGTC
jgi:hypothetical protein